MKLTKVYILKENYKNITNLFGVHHDIAFMFEGCKKFAFHIAKFYIFKLLPNYFKNYYKELYEKYFFEKSQRQIVRNINLMFSGEIKDTVKAQYHREYTCRQLIWSYLEYQKPIMKDLSSNLYSYPKLTKLLDDVNDLDEFYDEANAIYGENTEQYNKELFAESSDGYSWCFVDKNDKDIHCKKMGNCGMYMGKILSLFDKHQNPKIDIDCNIENNFIYISEVKEKFNNPISTKNIKHVENLSKAVKDKGLKFVFITKGDSANIEQYVLDYRRTFENFSKEQFLKCFGQDAYDLVYNFERDYK